VWQSVCDGCHTSRVINEQLQVQSSTKSPTEPLRGYWCFSWLMNLKSLTTKDTKVHEGNRAESPNFLSRIFFVRTGERQ
jgi:hypothetical protein